MKNNKVLVLEAHSDDSAISATGFLKLLKRKDYELNFYLAAVSTMHLHHAGELSRLQRIEEYASYVKTLGGQWDLKSYPPFDNESRLDQVPRADIVSVALTDGFDDIVQQMSDANHSRVPVYRDTLDDVAGIIHIKDLFANLRSDQTPSVESLLRPALFISPTIRLLVRILLFSSPRPSSSPIRPAAPARGRRARTCRRSSPLRPGSPRRRCLS